MRKRGRPSGLTSDKYYSVLRALNIGHGFNELAQSKIGVSRGTLRRVLKDAMLRGVITVNYHGKAAIYELTSHGYSLLNSMIFSVWWHMGRPRLDDGSGFDLIKNDLYATFLLDRYPTHALILYRDEAPELFKSLPEYVARKRFKIVELYESLGKRYAYIERAVDERLRAGQDPNTINQWLIKVEREGMPENIVLFRISSLFENGLICRRCFNQEHLISELLEVEDGYTCKECRKQYDGPENFLKSEFENWLKSFEGAGIPLRKKNILICPPKLKVGIFEA